MFFFEFHKKQSKKSTGKDKIRERQKKRAIEREKRVALFDFTEVCW